MTDLVEYNQGGMVAHDSRGRRKEHIAAGCCSWRHGFPGRSVFRHTGGIGEPQDRMVRGALRHRLEPERSVRFDQRKCPHGLSPLRSIERRKTVIWIMAEAAREGEITFEKV